MAKRNKARDYAAIAKFAEDFIDQDVITCINAYATKRKIVFHRAGEAFWSKVDDGDIVIAEREETQSFYEPTGKIIEKEVNGRVIHCIERQEVQVVVKIPYITAVVANAVYGTESCKSIPATHKI